MKQRTERLTRLLLIGGFALLPAVGAAQFAARGHQALAAPEVGPAGPAGPAAPGMPPRMDYRELAELFEKADRAEKSDVDGIRAGVCRRPEGASEPFGAHLVGVTKRIEGVFTSEDRFKILHIDGLPAGAAPSPELIDARFPSFSTAWSRADDAGGPAKRFTLASIRWREGDDYEHSYDLHLIRKSGGLLVEKVIRFTVTNHWEDRKTKALCRYPAGG